MKPTDPPMSPKRVGVTQTLLLHETLGQTEIGELDARPMNRPMIKRFEGFTSRCT